MVCPSKIEVHKPGGSDNDIEICKYSNSIMVVIYKHLLDKEPCIKTVTELYLKEGKEN